LEATFWNVSRVVVKLKPNYVAEVALSYPSVDLPHPDKPWESHFVTHSGIGIVCSKSRTDCAFVLRNFEAN
jgi:hypothetical protein